MSAAATRQEALRELAADLAYWPDDRIDVDTFTDCLSAECFSAVGVEPEPQIRDVTAEDFADAGAARLLAIALDAGQPDRTRCIALDVLRERYIGA